MKIPILATKLYIPMRSHKLVVRPQLIDRLNEGLHRKLTLISAPAGFGKTTLISDWIGDCQRPTAWLSLDEGDNNLIRFLSYLISSLQSLSPDIGDGLLSALQSNHPPTTESILTTLLNEITTSLDNFILVLDDYHVLDAEPIDDALTFLIEHQPPQMHLAITTREDPQLPLARLRVRGQMTELRVSDLRFTASEITEFINQVMNLNISADVIAILETRTEGWIAGLQMAAISMEGRTDTTSFIHAFTGSHRFVVDYLIEEILEHQPESIRNFLLQTSILERLSGSLCDTVTGLINSSEMLETLVRRNLLIIPLDDNQQWYRYHHLFADALQAHLASKHPDQASQLHRRAGEWYKQNNLPFDAIRHYFTAEDSVQVARLLESVRPTMESSFQTATWYNWVKQIPDELIYVRPVLSAGYGWAALDVGDLEVAETRFQDAERWLEPTADKDEMIIVDKAEFESLSASIATARAYRAMALGDTSATVSYAKQALSLLPDGEQRWREPASSLLGLAYWGRGELEEAHETLTQFMANMRHSGNISDVISVTFILADILRGMGRLREAITLFQQSLKLALNQGEPYPLGTADLYRGISELECEQGDSDSAEQYLILAERLDQRIALPNWQCRLKVSQALIKESQGEFEAALDLLDEAELLYIRIPLPEIRPINALKARLQIKTGQLIEASAWVHSTGLSVEDDLSYVREFEHITFVRVLIAQYRSRHDIDFIRTGMILIERLLQEAEAGRRTRAIIELRILEALIYQALDDMPQAFASLEHALTLAEPEGYVQIFVAEGITLRELLQDIVKQGIATNYVNHILNRFEKPDIKSPPRQLINSLSNRELDVLRLLASDLSGPEIADELMISLNTLRTHTKNIYSKLDVNSRRIAVRRADELDIM